MDHTQILQKLARELDLVLSRNWDPTFTVRKMSALTENDVEGYCSALEEELEVKNRTLTELTRAGELSTEIVERLRGRIAADEAEIQKLRAEHEALFSDFKALKEVAETNRRHLEVATHMLADGAEDRASLEKLVANLEAENRREGKRCAKLEKKFAHAAAAAAEAQDAAHKALKRAEAAEEQLATIRCAKWAE